LAATPLTTLTFSGCLAMAALRSASATRRSATAAWALVAVVTRVVVHATKPPTSTSPAMTPASGALTRSGRAEDVVSEPRPTTLESDIVVYLVTQSTRTCSAHVAFASLYAALSGEFLPIFFDRHQHFGPRDAAKK
jgi:hypothetical protein